MRAYEKKTMEQEMGMAFGICTAGWDTSVRNHRIGSQKAEAKQEESNDNRRKDGEAETEGNHQKSQVVFQ